MTQRLHWTVTGFALFGFAASSGQAAAVPVKTLSQTLPVVIAHRGASGYLPEHTLASYELAIRMGADFVEPDLQITKDGYLVAMHDADLDRTTNVKSLLGSRQGGYLVANYTLAEIRQLTVKPTGTASTTYPGFAPASANPFSVPTFDEVVSLVKQHNLATGQNIGLYPEAKQNDSAMEDLILQTLSSYGYTSGAQNVVIQSFSADTLKSIAQKQTANGLDFTLAQLGTTAISKFSEVAAYADIIGPSIASSTINANYIAQAHAAGLAVHGYTFSDADPTTAIAEYQKFFEWGMDGVFSNYTDLAVGARYVYVPEPASASLLILGGIAMSRRRRFA